MKVFNKILLFSLILSFGLAFCLAFLQPIDSQAATKTTLTLWHPYSGPPENKTIDKMAAEFTKTNPGIEIKVQYVGGSGSGQGITDKLMAVIAAKRPPNVVIFDRFMVPQWAAQGLFEDLTQLAQKYGIRKEMYYDFAWQEANYKGKLYALPTDTDTRALYWNKTMFKVAGLDPEKPPKTIAELDKYAEKLTIKKNNRYEQLGFIPWLEQGWLYTWGWVFGGDFQDSKTGQITADNSKVVKALEWMVGYAKKYNASAIQSFSTATSSNISPFIAKRVAMIVSGPWLMSQLKTIAPDIEYGVAPIPTPTGNNFASWAGGWSVIIPKGAKDKEVGFKLAKFFSVENGARIYGEDTSHFVSCKKINESLNWPKNYKYGDVFVKLFPVSKCRPPIPAGQLLWDELDKATNNAIWSKGKPQELLKKVSEKVNSELTKLDYFKK